MKRPGEFCWVYGVAGMVAGELAQAGPQQVGQPGRDLVQCQEFDGAQRSR